MEVLTHGLHYRPPTSVFFGKIVYCNGCGCSFSIKQDYINKIRPSLIWPHIFFISCPECKREIELRSPVPVGEITA